MAVGITSLLLWPMFTWSFGCTGRAKERGLDPAAFLADNDSTGFFEQMGDLLRPGPTFTNVNDFRAILVDSPMEPARNPTVG